MKKIVLFLISIAILFIVGCENTITLPQLDGKSRAEIEEIMKEYDINYEFKFSDKITIRNIFRYKSRVLTTIFGISV